MLNYWQTTFIHVEKRFKFIQGWEILYAELRLFKFLLCSEAPVYFRACAGPLILPPSRAPLSLHRSPSLTSSTACCRSRAWCFSCTFILLTWLFSVCSLFVWWHLCVAAMGSRRPCTVSPWPPTFPDPWTALLCFKAYLGLGLLHEHHEYELAWFSSIYSLSSFVLTEPDVESSYCLPISVFLSRQLAVYGVMLFGHIFELRSVCGAWLVYYKP
jgi:hypothetical protein